MIRYRLINCLIWLVPAMSFAQDVELHRQIASQYDQFKEKSIQHRRFKHADIQPLIDRFRSDDRFEVKKLGESIEGRSISLISIGEGDTDVLLWSQMHGNEPTATMATFDVFNFLADETVFVAEKEALLENVRIHFIPMLNPDGAERFQRRNALDVDLNRDALRLQSPEARILKAVRDSLDADFGFNLHDQSKYYNANRTEKPATISYLAPAYNYEKEINEVRANAMKIIILMNQIVQEYAPGQVGRYSDSFEPRAFGDNIQKWGTSTILIESGGHYNDPEKQFIRKLNYISILTSIFSIGDGGYKKLSLADYEKIPRNDRKLFDLKLEKVTYNLHGQDYVVDVGIVRNEIENEASTEFYYEGAIAEIGDLSIYYGYETIDATGLRFAPGKVSRSVIPDRMTKEDFAATLKQGYTDVEVVSTVDHTHSIYPINLIMSKNPAQPTLNLGQEPTFLLMDGEEVKYVIVNGFVFDPSKENSVDDVVNGVVK